MLPNVLQPNTTDHVPVLADEVRELLALEPGHTLVDAHLRRRRPRVAARARPPRQRQGDRDRPRPDRAPVLRALPPHRRRARALPARRLLDRPQPARRERRARRRDPARPRRLQHAARPARARLLVRDRRAARHADGSRPPTSRRGELVNEADGARAREDLPALRRGALRAPDRARDRPPPAADSRSSAPASSSTTIKAAIPAPARFGEGHPAKRVFQALADRGERGARRARGRAARPPSRCSGRVVASP